MRVLRDCGVVLHLHKVSGLVAVFVAAVSCCAILQEIWSLYVAFRESFAGAAAAAATQEPPEQESCLEDFALYMLPPSELNSSSTACLVSAVLYDHLSTSILGRSSTCVLDRLHVDLR